MVNNKLIVRTYIRTLFNDIFKNNFIAKAIIKIVNFYCSFFSKAPETIKFETNMPINKMEKKYYRFFQSVTGDKIDCK